MAHIITSRDQARARRRPAWPFCANEDSWQNNGLLHWFPFAPTGSASTNLRDAKEHASHLPPVGSPAWYFDDEMGSICKTNYLTPDYFQKYPSTDHYTGKNAITVTVWFRLSQTPAATGMLFNRGQYQAPFWIQHYGDLYRIRYGINSVTDGAKYVLTPESWGRPITEWTLATVTYDATGDIVGYKNGEYANHLQTLATTLVGGGSNQYFNSFANTDGNTPARNATIAELRIYLRAFSRGEAAALYDPATRWDLYYPLGRRTYFVLGAGAGAEKTFQAALEAAVSFAVVLSPERPIAAALAVSADLSAALTVQEAAEVTLQAALEVSADLAAALAAERPVSASIDEPVDLEPWLTVERPVAAALETSADLAAALALERPMAAVIEVTADFVAALTIQTAGVVSFEASLEASADLTASLSIERPIAAALEVSTDLGAAARIDRNLMAALEALAQMEAEVEFTTGFAAALEASADVAVHLRAERLLAADLDPSVAMAVNLSIEGIFIVGAFERWARPGGGRMWYLPGGGKSWKRPSG